MASNEEKLSIAKYFIMNSPPGEVNEVVKDVRKILKKKDILTSDALQAILKEYNVKMLTSSSIDCNTSCLTSQYGNVSGHQYVDPKSGNVYKFDYERETWAKVDGGEQKVSSSPHRAPVQAAMDDYAAQHYQDKCCPLVYASDDNNITVCLSSRDLGLNNYWTGLWKAVYTINCGSKGSTMMKADIDIIVHYYEDGNVQLRSHYDEECKVIVGSPEETAANIREGIKKIESSLHEGLEKMYVDLHLSIFKSFRRFLPCTRQQMNWDLAIHNVNDGIAKSHQ